MARSSVTLKIRVPRGAREFEEDEFAEQDSEPQEGDYIKSDTRRGIAVTQQNLNYYQEFNDHDAADKAIRARMKREQWWTNVWWLSDHGNLSVDSSFSANATSRRRR